MLSSRAFKTLSNLTYFVLVITTICAVGLSCVSLLSQAVRTAPNESWSHNFNALVIGASYAIVLVASLVLCAKRRLAVRLRLQRISKAYRIIGRGDVPKSVHEYITQEYTRACLVVHESQPKGIVQEGWGRPGTKYSGVRFRRALLDTIPEIDKLAHLVIPTHPALKSHSRMLHHFRFIQPLIPKDEDYDGLSLLHYYDSAIQLARNSIREPTEAEYVIGMEAAEEIKRSLEECRLGMAEDSSTQLNGNFTSLEDE